MAESSNVESSKPTTVEDLIQLLTTQQRLQQEKFFETMSTFSTALQASVPVRQQQEAALPQTTPKFEAFDSTAELWTDYWSRFSTFTNANSVPDVRVAKKCLMFELLKFFYKSNGNYLQAALHSCCSGNPAKNCVNDLTMNKIQQYMMNQFHPKRFVVRERFRYWSDMKR